MLPYTQAVAHRRDRMARQYRGFARFGLSLERHQQAAGKAAPAEQFPDIARDSVKIRLLLLRECLLPLGVKPLLSRSANVASRCFSSVSAAARSFSSHVRRERHLLGVAGMGAVPQIGSTPATCGASST